MRHAFDAASGLRIEISVENAAAAAKLELEPCAFAYLQCGVAEALDEIARGQTEKLAAALRRRRYRRWLRLRLLRARRAGSEEKGRGKSKAAHDAFLSLRAQRSNPARCAMAIVSTDGGG
jgi:hypothetical protein